MNPLLEDIVSFLRAGLQFAQINPAKSGTGSRNVQFVFADGTTETRTYQCDHATFMQWWRRTTGYLRTAADAFAQADVSE
jgi:hypothetical protein